MSSGSDEDSEVEEEMDDISDSKSLVNANKPWITLYWESHVALFELGGTEQITEHPDSELINMIKFQIPKIKEWRNKFHIQLRRYRQTQPENAECGCFYYHMRILRNSLVHDNIFKFWKRNQSSVS